MPETQPTPENAPTTATPPAAPGPEVVPAPPPAIEAGSTVGPSRSGGRLSYFATAWVAAPPSVLTIVKRGFHWTWLSRPPRLRPPQYTQSRAHTCPRLGGKRGRVPCSPTTLLPVQDLHGAPTGWETSPHHHQSLASQSFILAPSSTWTTMPTLAQVLLRQLTWRP